MALSNLKDRLSAEKRTAQLHLKVRPEVAQKLRQLVEQYNVSQGEIVSELIMEAKT